MCGGCGTAWPDCMHMRKRKRKCKETWMRVEAVARRVPAVCTRANAKVKARIRGRVGWLGHGEMRTRVEAVARRGPTSWIRANANGIGGVRGHVWGLWRGAARLHEHVQTQK